MTDQVQLLPSDEWTMADYHARLCTLGEVGRPKYDRNYATRLARQKAGKAMEALVKLLDNDDPNVVLKAAQALLDRGFGKAESGVAPHGQQQPGQPDPFPWVSAKRLAAQQLLVDTNVAEDVKEKVVLPPNETKH